MFLCFADAEHTLTCLVGPLSVRCGRLGRNLVPTPRPTAMEEEKSALEAPGPKPPAEKLVKLEQPLASSSSNSSISNSDLLGAQIAEAVALGGSSHSGVADEQVYRDPAPLKWKIFEVVAETNGQRYVVVGVDVFVSRVCVLFSTRVWRGDRSSLRIQFTREGQLTHTGSHGCCTLPNHLLNTGNREPSSRRCGAAPSAEIQLLY